MVVKTGQLTNRAIYVYLPTVDMAQEWKSLADKAKISISKFVTEHVENSLKQEQEKSRSTSRAVLLKQLKEQEEKISSLKQEVKLLKMLSENLDKELRKYRAQPFVDESRQQEGPQFEGVREYDRDLIVLLRKNQRIDNEVILKELGVSPKDLDLVKAVKRQLRNLQAYGLIEPTARGWRWLG